MQRFGMRPKQRACDVTVITDNTRNWTENPFLATRYLINRF